MTVSSGGVPRPSRVAGVTQREVDGLRVLTAKASGPLRAVLLFRVGQADETLPTRGITHLTEHLALTNTAAGPHAFNGATGDLVTSFVVAGDPTDVASHLTSVCKALSDLPLDRLEHERGVLRTEAATAGGGFVRSLATWRWGAGGYGLLGFDEMGLDALTGEAVQQWARERFTAESAVLWLSGDVPAGLSLDLPRRPPGVPALPAPSLSPVIPLPASYSFSDRGVAFSYLAPRTAEGPALVYLLTKRLQDRLRNQLGASYRIESALDRISGDTSMHVYFADCLPEKAGVVQEGVEEVLRSVRRSPATAEEMRDILSSCGFAKEADAEARRLGHLDYVARQLLLGGQLSTAATIDREQLAVTSESLHEYARAALDSLLLAVPDAERSPEDVARPAALWSPTPVQGVPYSPAPARADRRLTELIVGADGASLMVGENPITVRFAECAAMIRYDDGARTLIGHDALRLDFRPEDWVGSVPVPGVLDRNVPTERWIAGGQRDVPARTAPAPAAKAGGGRRRWFVFRPTRLAIIATLFALGGVGRLLGHDDSPPPAAGVDGADALGSFGVVAARPGACLLTAAGLQTDMVVPVPCSEPHEDEIFDRRAVPPSLSARAQQARCRVAALHDLTPAGREQVTIHGFVTSTGDLVCYAQAKSVQLLDGSILSS